jgi:DNA repair protein RadD
MTLRPYQQKAIDALFDYLSSKKGNPLIVLPTGSGKSHVQAGFIRQVLDKWPNERFLLLSHVKELLVQNAEKLSELKPALYSAGLGTRNTGQITIAGIQSVHKKAHEMGDISIVIIDECHLVSKTGNTMYQKFIKNLKGICPHVRVVGMSATPYRLDSGSLTQGTLRIFTDVVHESSILELIEQGYLSPIKTAETTRKVDTTNIRRAHKEYVIKELDHVARTITEDAINEIEILCSDRKSWLVFCVSVGHASEVAKAITQRGYKAAAVTGKTPKQDRDRLLTDFKEGRLRALTSVNVLTTGFDAPNADALICLRPTMSPGLWVQMVGRGLRIAPGKKDCLVLDFTTNTYTHGPIDKITCDNSGDVNTSPYIICEGCGAQNEPSQKNCHACSEEFCKTCPSCMSLIAKGCAICPNCKQWLTRERKVNHERHVQGGEVISGEQEQIDVEDWEATQWVKKGKPVSMCMIYYTGIRQYREWICFQHDGYAKDNAHTWWYNHGGLPPVPSTVSEALNRITELGVPKKISVEYDGKYWGITHCEIDTDTMMPF